MGNLKTEINLRTREFVISREFYWPRLAVTIAVILLLSATAVGVFLSYLYIYNLQNDLVYLSGRAEELKLKAAPVIELEQSIDQIKQKAALRQRLLETVTPWSDYLKRIKAAAGKEITVAQVAASGEGKINITGQGATLRDIATYIQDLQDLDFLSQVTIGHISLEKENRFGFVLNAISSTGGGLGDYE